MVPVKVLGDGGGGSEWSVAQGILYSAGLLEDNQIKPVDIMNLSLGMDGNSATPELIKRSCSKS